MVPEEDATDRASGPQPPIGDYAPIGDGRSAALVSRDGSIDWLCWPRIDSAPVLGFLVDERGGRWRIAPRGTTRVRRRYVGDTNVLRTRFEGPDGALDLVDLMPLPDATDRACPFPEHEIVRVAECVRGEVVLETLFDPRPDWGLRRARWHDGGALGWYVETGRGTLFLRGPRPVPGPDGARSAIPLRTGQRAEFSLVFALDGPAVLPPRDPGCRRTVDSTLRWWSEWAGRCRYRGPFREAVVRSALALKLLTYAPSGAILAAPTTSLPERPGAPYNWDYRYCWLRDAAFTARALFGLGYFDEGEAFVNWLLYTTRLTRPRLQVLYDVFGSQPRPERELSHLSGWRGSRPVRVGNDAARQAQLDIYGEVVDAAMRYAREGGTLDREMISMLAGFGRHVAAHWREPDAGIWETRGPPRAHTHSRVLCWAALDGLVRLSRLRPLAPGVARTLAAERDAIRHAIETESWDAGSDTYVRTAGGTQVDAALLMMPAYGYIAADNPRMLGTRAAIRARLGAGDLLYRHSERETEGEAAFAAAAFWEADYLARGGGSIGEAASMLGRLVSRANDVGLLAEEVDPATGELLGNFPQGFSHVGLVNAALSLQARVRRSARGLRGHHPPRARSGPLPGSPGVPGEVPR